MSNQDAYRVVQHSTAIDLAVFKAIADAVETEWQVGGLSDGLYYDYALEICRRYLSINCGVVMGVARVGDCDPAPETTPQQTSPTR